MNSGQTSERIYDALKRRLLAGDFKPGDRLDPAILSETLASSVTPVRDVLHILTGEGLLETRTGEGFFRPQLTAPDLEDLYDWSNQVLRVALHERTRHSVAASLRREGIADRTSDLFLRIGGMSRNAEHKRAIAGVSDRLHAVRNAEPRAIGGVAGELDRIERSLEAEDLRDLAKILSAYHRRRIRAASEIVRAVYRDDRLADEPER